MRLQAVLNKNMPSMQNVLYQVECSLYKKHNRVNYKRNNHIFGSGSFTGLYIWDQHICQHQNRASPVYTKELFEMPGCFSFVLFLETNKLSVSIYRNLLYLITTSYRCLCLFTFIQRSKLYAQLHIYVIWTFQICMKSCCQP